MNKVCTGHGYYLYVYKDMNTRFNGQIGHLHAHTLNTYRMVSIVLKRIIPVHIIVNLFSKL